MKSIHALAIIFVVSWILIIGESYIFFAVIRPLGPPLHLGFRFGYFSSVVKVLGTAGLAVAWNVVMLALWGAYVRSRRSKRSSPPTSSS